MAVAGLTLENLTLPKERTYFWIIAIFATLIWLLLVFTIVWIFLGLALAFFVWLANGLLIARLKSESVKVTETQMTELQRTFADVCAKLGCAPRPDLYVLQSGGLLNAFATRRSGRDFVVLYSDVVEAYGTDSDEIKFILGHEIGHLQRRHLSKRIFLGPGLFLPLIGHAYSRACEASCDRYGAYATENIDGALMAMMKLSGGKEAGRVMNPDEFALQYHRERGFFISWHELISGYPTLSQRMANLIAIRDNRPAEPASRNPFAYFFAFFSLGGATTSGGGILTTIIMISLLSGLLFPAILGAQGAAQRAKAHAELQEIEERIEEAKDEAEERLEKKLKENGKDELTPVVEPASAEPAAPAPAAEN